MNSKLFYAVLTFLFCFFPHVSEAPTWSSAITLVLAGMAAYVSRTGYVLVSRRAIRALTVLLPALVLWQFRTILGPEPASTLLCMLVALKLHEVDSPRDEQVILILNSLVVMTWLLFSQSLFSTVYMILALLLIGIGLIAIQTPNRSIRQIISSTPTRLGLDIALALPLFLLFFFLFPRFTTPLSTLFATQKTQTGFSENLTPGMWAELVQSDEIAFRVIFNEGQRLRQSQLYWRGLVLNEVTGFNWSRPARIGAAAYPVDENATGDTEYELILEPRYGRTLFHLERGVNLKVKDSQIRNRVISRGSFYNLVGENVHRLSLLGTSQTTNPIYNEEPNPRDSLAPEISNEIKTLIANLKKSAAASNAEAFAQAVMRYFSREGFQYTTSTPQMNQVDEFLFRYKAGFCEHYASAFSLLMRAAGYPARVVIGFQGGEYNTYGNYMIVRDRNAHAWSEVYINGIGWKRFDPTTAVNSSRIETGDFISPLFAGLDRNSTLAQNLQSALNYFEAINTQYILFLLNFNSDTQIEWLSDLGFKGIRKPHLFAAIGGGILVFILLAVWLIYRRPIETSPLTQGYSILLDQIAKSGLLKAPHEGPLTFLSRLEKEDSKSALNVHKKLLLEYIHLAYGPSDKQQHLNFLKQTERL